MSTKKNRKALQTSKAGGRRPRFGQQYGIKDEGLNNKPALLLRGGEVAEELGISRALAFRWMQNGVLPVVRVSGARTVRVPRAALIDWVKRQTKSGGAAA